MLEIKNLHVTINEKEILKGFNLKVNAGEIHAIMGPNGAGKSTLAKVLAGHPDCTITQGEILFDGTDICEMDPEDRASLGIFMGFQYPIEIGGLTNLQFLHAAFNALCKKRGEPVLSEEAFSTFLDEKMQLMDMRGEFKLRKLNEGFSGGEKKRNEILQMAVLNPRLAILDETDSGLDIDALRTVSKGVNQIMNPNRALIVITHYQRLLEYIQPQFVHVVLDGKIVQSGGSDLAQKLEDLGYDWLVSNAR